MQIEIKSEEFYFCLNSPIIKFKNRCMNYVIKFLVDFLEKFFPSKNNIFPG